MDMSRITRNPHCPHLFGQAATMRVYERTKSARVMWLTREEIYEAIHGDSISLEKGEREEGDREGREELSVLNTKSASGEWTDSDVSVILKVLAMVVSCVHEWLY